MERSYEAVVEEVLAGDDLRLLVDLGVDNLLKRVRARLHGVDTPPSTGLTPSPEALRVREQVIALVGGHACRIDLVSEGRGGWLIVLHVDGMERSLNELLRSQGHVFRGAARRGAP